MDLCARSFGRIFFGSNPARSFAGRSCRTALIDDHCTACNVLRKISSRIPSKGAQVLWEDLGVLCNIWFAELHKKELHGKCCARSFAGRSWAAGFRDLYRRSCARSLEKMCLQGYGVCKISFRASLQRIFTLLIGVQSSTRATARSNAAEVRRWPALDVKSSYSALAAIHRAQSAWACF